MSKKHPPAYPPHLVTVADKQGNVLTDLSERIYMAAAERPAPTVREDLQAIKRRPLDAPMATPIHSLPASPASMISGLSDPPAMLA